jgi:hypothetical protein
MIRMIHSKLMNSLPVSNAGQENNGQRRLRVTLALP